MKGISPFSNDAQHFHHRLATLGFSPTKTIFILFIVCFYLNLTSLLPAYNIDLIPHFIPLYFLFVIINIAVLLLILKRLEKKKQEKYHGNLCE